MAVEISEIALLVHPDFHLVDGLSLDQRHKQMRRRWDAKVVEIAGNRSQAMFYYSAIGFDEKRDLDPELRHMERERQIFYGLLLRSRFFYFYKPNLPEDLTVGQLLTERGLSLAKNDVKVEAFGEYQEKCVDDWGRGFRYVLQRLGAENINLQVNSNLCVRFQDYHEL